jgi:flagellar motility protein MotE (MotC chaperone)
LIHQHEGRGGGPHDKISKIDAAIDNVEAEQRSVVRRINHLNLEQKEDIGALTAKEEALLEQLRKEKEQLRTEKEQLRAEKLILLERGEHSGPVQICGC